jgi:hypothetical protein
MECSFWKCPEQKKQWYDYWKDERKNGMKAISIPAAKIAVSRPY